VAPGKDTRVRFGVDGPYWHRQYEPLVAEHPGVRGRPTSDSPSYGGDVNPSPPPS
jgi:hypothetical protein